MNSQSAQRLLDSIDQTISDIDSISGTSHLNDSYLAKFLVVYICGIYEEAIENIVIDFISQNTSRVEIVQYVEKNLKSYFRNPDFSKIISLIGSFGNNRWTTEIKQMKSESIALDSIVTNKNGLAHGQSFQTTLVDIKQYYVNSRSLIEKIDSLLV